MLHCSAEPVDRCSYCGQHFCALHGDVNRRVCNGCLPRFFQDAAREAAEALEARRREIGVVLNGKGLCGTEGCGNPMLTCCDRCKVHYCSRHVSRHEYSYRHRTLAGTHVRRGTLVLCSHCTVFLDEYRRDRYSLV